MSLEKYLELFDEFTKTVRDDFSLFMEYWTEKEPRPAIDTGEIVQTNLDFSDALKFLRAGKNISRATWQHGPIVPYIYAVPNTFGIDEDIFLVDEDGTIEEWFATTADVMAKDWMVVKVDLTEPGDA